MEHNLTEGILLVAVILFLFLGNIRGALIVTLTIPFSLLFASICLDLRKIPANLLSLGALDFGMIVEGAVVMVENIVRMLSGSASTEKSAVRAKISEAAHEVQRPVFYAITIIITAYLPIFTLQRVEGRLFKPMAWTVVFALAGALLFSMVLAPVIASFLFPRGAREWHNPLMDWMTRAYATVLGKAIRFRWVTLGIALAAVGGNVAAGAHDRVGIPAASGRRRDLGSRNAGSEHRADRRRARGEPGARDSRGVPGGDRSPPARWAVRTTARTPPDFSTPNTSSI